VRAMGRRHAVVTTGIFLFASCAARAPAQPAATQEEEKNWTTGFWCVALAAGTDSICMPDKQHCDAVAPTGGTVKCEKRAREWCIEGSEGWDATGFTHCFAADEHCANAANGARCAEYSVPIASSGYYCAFKVGGGSGCTRNNGCAGLPNWVEETYMCKWQPEAYCTSVGAAEACFATYGDCEEDAMHDANAECRRSQGGLNP
jgi:hypothetical protein